MAKIVSAIVLMFAFVAGQAQGDFRPMNQKYKWTQQQLYADTGFIDTSVFNITNPNMYLHVDTTGSSVNGYYKVYAKEIANPIVAGLNLAKSGDTISLLPTIAVSGISSINGFSFSGNTHSHGLYETAAGLFLGDVTDPDDTLFQVGGSGSNAYVRAKLQGSGSIVSINAFGNLSRVTSASLSNWEFIDTAQSLLSKTTRVSVGGVSYSAATSNANFTISQRSGEQALFINNEGSDPTIRINTSEATNIGSGTVIFNNAPDIINNEPPARWMEIIINGETHYMPLWKQP